MFSFESVYLSHGHLVRVFAMAQTNSCTGDYVALYSYTLRRAQVSAYKI